MWNSDCFWKTTVILLWISLVCCSFGKPEIKAEKYLISAEEDAKSEQLAAYLFYHLSKRTKEKSSVELHKGTPPRKIPKGVKNIHIEVMDDLKNSYCIEHTSSRLLVQVCEWKTALWIVYQIIGKIAAEDQRFVANDIPPPMIDFNTGRENFDFTFREPFFALNLEEDVATMIGTNNVDTDWGIWGHNLSKILDPHNGDDLFAMVDGERNRDQICFSSPVLFEQLCAYIIDNYGDGTDQSVRFMIAPNDNSLVCTCNACTALGNTEKYATPAVHSTIIKLSERFPNHQFYMTAYHTTAMPTNYHLPKKCGVFLSSIHLPKGVALDSQPQVNEFLQLLDAWRTKTDNVYIWDYAANFDDYLTPIPVLLSLQQQLKFYKKNGIKGVFLNASGYDYSPFDDVKTFVAAALMMDVDADVEKLITQFHQKKYPQTHDLINNYFISLEKRFFSMDMPYDMYGGMRENVTSYLDKEEFVRFYDALRDALPSTTGDEHYLLRKLYTALTFTRLQIAYIQGADRWGYALKKGDKMVVKPEIATMIEDLRQFANYDNMQNYKEFDGSLARYIGQWEHLLQLGDFENLLLEMPVEVSTNTSERAEKTMLLTDGTPGFTQDYHDGWFLVTADEMSIHFPAVSLDKTKMIKLRFLQMEKHDISLPTHIELVVDGVGIPFRQVDNNATTEDPKGAFTMSYVLPVDFSGNKSFEIKIWGDKESKSIVAIDEVQFLSEE